jgi:hypothetical protein
MKNTTLITIIVFLSGCMQNVQNEISDDEKLADECLQKAAVQLKKEKDLYLCGTGGGMMDQIRMLALSFNYYKPVDIEKGRELLISAVNQLADVVNADERIRPYLKNYPFGPENIEIRIFIKNPDGSSVSSEKLRVISAEEGFLNYYIDNPTGGLFITVLKETYETACCNFLIIH